MDIRESKTAACAFGSAVDFAGRFLARHASLSSGSVDLQAWFKVIEDATDASRRHDALRISWKEPLPHGPGSFEGLLTVRPASGHTLVTLEGDGSDLGMTRTLLENVVAHIEEEWRAFVSASPTVKTCNERNRALGNACSTGDGRST